MNNEKGGSRLLFHLYLLIITFDINQKCSE